MRHGNLYLNDPADLTKWSSGAFRLFLQLEMLDFARRYYKRQDDKISKLRSIEIQKLLHQISEMQTIAVRSLIPFNIMHKRFELLKEKNAFLE